MADDAKARLDSISDQLKQLRDELEVQLHLGAAEAREEWDKLEDQMQGFKSQYDKVADAAEDTLEGVADAASMAGDELVRGYKRIRGMLSR